MLPVLSTPRLLLQPTTPADAGELLALWTMPEVRLYLFDNRVVGRAEVAEMIDRFATHHDRGLGMWTIRRHDDGEFVGEIALAPADEMVPLDPALDGEIEFEIGLHPVHWGLGLAAEALEAVVRHGFVTLGLARILGVADAPNVASRRLQERAGFVWRRRVPGPVHDADILFLERP